jgi:hypothetical protein
MRTRLSALAALALALACRRAEERPDEAYRAFARAVADRDADRAYALLSSDTQAWLDERARSAAASAPGVVPSSGRSLLLGDASLAPRQMGEVVVLREARDRAVLSVAEEGAGKGDVELVRERGWRVRIPAPPAR